MWELIRSNQRKSIALFLILGVLFLVMGYVLGVVFFPRNDPDTYIAISLVIWLIYSVVGYYSGAELILLVSAARPASKEDDPRLFNVVEEMKIAAGFPAMPKIYVMNENAMNAMAVGRGPANCAIVVTKGLLSNLDRDELQGVVAHEISHIVNRDSLFMTFAGATLGSITLLSNMFWWSTNFSKFKSKSSRDASGIVVFWILALLLASVGVTLAQLLYFAFVRKREYLADASAVRLTRYPEGLASALEKIDNSGELLVRFNRITAPMFIANPIYGERFSLLNFSTHPPIWERIKILRMLGGAGYKDYQMAYSSVKGKTASLIPQHSLGRDQSISLRELATKAPVEDRFVVRRRIGDSLMAADNYIFLNCVCGLKIKVPPALNARTIDCPKCGHRFAGSLK